MAAADPFRRKGGASAVNIIIAFMVSVAAGVVTHYICKWLDGHK